MKIKRLILNSFSLALIRPLSMLINLAAFPILMDVFGKELFGIYILAVTFASSIVAFDFGIQSNIVKVVAESRATGVISEAKKVTNFAAKVYWVTGGIFLAAALIVGFWLESLFKIPESLHSQFIWVALHAGVAAVFIIRLKVEEAILDAYEYHFVRNLVAIFPAIGTLILIFFVRDHKIGFNYFVSFSFFFLIIPGLANYVVRRWMKLLPGSLEESVNIPADFVKNSIDTFITQMLAFLNFSGQQYFVGVVMGPAAVAIFASATRPVFMLRIMTSQTALPLMPQIVALLKSGKNTELVQFMRNANTLILIILLSASLPLLACSELFFRTWLHNDATELAYLSNIAILGLVFSGCAGVVSRYFVFSGEPRRIAIIQAKCSGVFVVTSLISLYWGGMEFFLWSIAGNAMLVSSLVFKEYIQQAGISWRDLYPSKLIIWLLAAMSVTLVARIFIKNLSAQWVWFGLSIVPLGLFMGLLSYCVFHKEIKEAFRKSKTKS